MGEVAFGVEGAVERGRVVVEVSVVGVADDVGGRVAALHLGEALVVRADGEECGERAALREAALAAEVGGVSKGVDAGVEEGAVVPDMRQAASP